MTLHAYRTHTIRDNAVLAAPTRVIEVGERTAGIAVPEHGGVRFFSSDRTFDTLEGTLFRSVVQATRAVQSRARGTP